MFGKLMKAEWRASRRVVGILCLAVLIAALVLGLVGCGLFMAETRGWSVHGTVEMIVALLCVAAVMVIAVAWAASIFYALWRFYRSRFTEEGYLTFTLPVNGHQLMLSSILSSILEILAVLLATAVACVLGLGISALGIPWNEAPADFWPRLWEQLGELWQEFVPYGGAVAEAALAAFLTSLSRLIMLMLAVTIGGMAAKKHPILMALLAYCGIGFVQMVISLTVLASDLVLTNGLTVGTMYAMPLVTILGGYFLMYFLTTRKLNLN